MAKLCVCRSSALTLLWQRQRNLSLIVNQKQRTYALTISLFNHKGLKGRTPLVSLWSCMFGFPTDKEAEMTKFINAKKNELISRSLSIEETFAKMQCIFDLVNAKYSLSMASNKTNKRCLCKFCLQFVSCNSALCQLHLVTSCSMCPGTVRSLFFEACKTMKTVTDKQKAQLVRLQAITDQDEPEPEAPVGSTTTPGNITPRVLGSGGPMFGDGRGEGRNFILL